MGTPDFAVPSLRALLDNGYQVVGVFCQPDRPKGRGHKLAACPVKETAVAAGIPVFQPERIKRVSGALLAGQTVRYWSAWPVAGEAPAGVERAGTP